MNERFERKWALNQSVPIVREWVRHFPGFFEKEHPRRRVNSLYFDSVDFEDGLDTVNGHVRRRKVRIRWYGPVFGRNLDARLEIKEKRNRLGTKQVHVLKNFGFEEGMSEQEIWEVVRDSDLPNPALQSVLARRPQVVVTYRREYFRSRDRRVRITLDSDLSYFAFRSKGLGQGWKSPGTVMEMKYSESDGSYAQEILSQFAFRPEKNSKYIQGVQRSFL